MFSIITMESSTTKPVAMMSAMIERLSSENPHRYMKASVPTRETGTEMLGMMVARMLRRKTKMTATTRKMLNASSNPASDTEARIDVVPSLITAICMEAGSPAVSTGSARLIASTVAMTLAFGWRWMLSTMAGVRFAQAPSSVFCGADMIFATSPR